MGYDDICGYGRGCEFHRSNMQLRMYKKVLREYMWIIVKWSQVKYNNLTDFSNISYNFVINMYCPIQSSLTIASHRQRTSLINSLCNFLKLLLFIYWSKYYFLFILVSAFVSRSLLHTVARLWRFFNCLRLAERYLL